MTSYLSRKDGETKVVLNLDASLFKQSACLRKIEYITQYGYREKVLSPSLGYGSAFHEYIKVLRRTGNPALAITAAVEFFRPVEGDWRTLTHLVDTCTSYHAKVYIRDNFRAMEFEGHPLVEQKFSFPYYESEHLIVNLCGTIDEIGQMENNEITICDRKTSSMYKTDEYFKAYEMSPQLKFYVMITQMKLELKQIPAFIDAVFISENRPTQFKRSELFYYTEEQILSLRRQIDRLIKDIEDAIKTKHWQQNITQCDKETYTKDKLCKYFRVCSIADTELREHFIERDYIQIPYDPMTFGEQTV